MRALTLPLLASTLSLVACGRGPSLEARTFDLRYLDPGEAEQMIKPYVYTDRPDAPGRLSMMHGGLSVRETRDNLDRIARVLAEHDRPPATARLTFQVIRADGDAAPDSAIRPIEQQLRQLFRFRGYQLVTQGMTNVGAGAPLVLRLEGAGGPYELIGHVETVSAQGDSGIVTLAFGFVAGHERVMETRVSLRLGQTMVLGGQSGNGPGAIILAVKPELAR
jgi:type II secretory pathway component GspD/PulD (secretin)